ncbi:MAG: amidohydrolase, partial [Actinomycetota bacterium]
MLQRHFTNGRFLTLNAERPDPTHLAAVGGRIVSLDSTPRPNSRDSIDLGGRVVIPGPVDAHCHLVSYGMLEVREADLRGAASVAEIIARLREHARNQGIQPGSGRWLLGRGFDQERLPERAWPTRADLDAVDAATPIRITRVCGHALAANGAALHLAGLDPNTQLAGFPKGVLTETAMAPLNAAIPPPTPGEWVQAAAWACHAAARAGFVGVHSLMAHAHEVRALAALRAADRLPIRVRMQLPYSMLECAVATGLRTGFGDELLNFGAVKLFSDGSLGARTAALRAPYSDDPATAGELIHSDAELTRRVLEIYRGGFQACIHAIGDRAMDSTLTALELAGDPSRGGVAPVAPPRIEHASMVDRGLIQRMRAIGAGAAVQPQFAWSDHWLQERVGPERAQGCYAFRTMWEAGAPLAGSTDCPVEPLDAMAA